MIGDPPNVTQIGREGRQVVRFVDVLEDPTAAIAAAASSSYSAPTPLYPGVRAPAQPEFAAQAQACVIAAAAHLGIHGVSWSGQVWWSLVTRAPDALTPIQRLPHVDGTDPDQVAFLLYLNRTPHGGTNFFRHRATGFESLTAERWPIYKRSLEAEVAAKGLPPAGYLDDTGGALFERIYAAPPAFNSAVVYPGNVLHSGSIAAGAPLSADPALGRLTLNGFFRPA